MATYVNDLRLKEIATGDESGTWGTSTNTNLELIAEAFSFGTEAITTNADTHTTTIADGSTDPGRSLYLKYTGTLDSACTITIGPNTVSKLWFIENGTSGSQNIIISQGSGANITIPAGDVKVVYSDGAGSGAAVVDAFASLNVVDLKVQDDLTVTDDMTVGGTLGVTGVVTANAGVVVDEITIDGDTITATDDFIIDVADDITFDADGGDFFFKDGGTQKLHLDATGRLLIGADSGDAFNDDAMLRLQRTGDRIFQSFKVDADQTAAIFFGDVDDDIECGIQYQAANRALEFSTGNNAEALRIDSGGLVGIGTTVPAELLHLKGGTGNDSAEAPIIRIQKHSGGAVDDGQTIGGMSFWVNDDGVDSGASKERAKIIAESQNTSSATRLEFYTSNSNEAISERMRIIGDGKVGINQSSPAAQLHATIEGSVPTISSNTVAVFNRSGGLSHEAYVSIIGGATGASAIHFGDTADEDIGRIAYTHASGNADIMAFQVAGAERMRVDSAGDVMIGNTTVNPASSHSDQKGFGYDASLGSLEVAAIGGSAAVFGLNQSAATDVVVFRKQGTQRGSVGITDSGTSFNTSSDARLKTVLGKAEGLEVINKLNPVNFEWNESKEIQDGLIAQEVMEIIPHAVSKNSDDYYEMDYSRVVTPLIKAIQEQQEQINTLQSEINKLKGE